MKLKLLFRNGAKETIELEKPNFDELFGYIQNNKLIKMDKGIINFDEVVLIWEAETQSKIGETK